MNRYQFRSWLKSMFANTLLEQSNQRHLTRIWMNFLLKLLKHAGHRHGDRRKRYTTVRHG